MAQDAICPHCLRTNHRVYLEETGGMMECIFCGADSRFEMPGTNFENVEDSRKKAVL